MSGEVTASIAIPFRRSFNLPPEDNTLTVWPQRFDRRTIWLRPAPRRVVPTELVRPLSANTVLRARFGVGRRHSAVIGVCIGALAVVGIAISLASYTHDDGSPSPSLSPTPAPTLAPAGAVAMDPPPRTRALPADVAPPRTVNLITNVDIKTTYNAPPPTPAPTAAAIAERRTFVSRDRPRVRKARQQQPATKPVEKKTLKPAPAVEDNPYASSSAKTPAPTLTAQPAVEDNPY